MPMDIFCEMGKNAAMAPIAIIVLSPNPSQIMNNGAKAMPGIGITTVVMGSTNL
jgi:hypothetical protein